nr:hypothetical protein [Tanacetum cinerariifolium]
MLLIYEVTLADIQYSAATKIWGCYRLASRAKVIENQGADEDLLNDSSLPVIVYGYDEHPMQPVAPPSLNYIPGLEEPQTPPVPQDEDEREPMFIQPHDPDYVPEPMYPEYIPLEDEHVLPAEEQPLPPVVSPTAESPGYVAESDPEEDPEEYEDDESEDGPIDYPMDGGDDGDDDDGDSFVDDADDEGDEDEEAEEGEHLAPANYTNASIPLSPEAEVGRLLAKPTPPPSPLTSLSPPSAGERLTRCTALSAHSSPSHALIDAVSAALPSPPLPPLPPPLYIPSHVDRRDDIPETELPPRKKLCLFALGFRYEIGDSSITRPTESRWIDYGFVSTLDAEARRRGIREVGYSIRDNWVDLVEAVPEIAPMTLGEWVDFLMEILIEEEEADAAELLALREQPRRARQPRSDARVPHHQDAPRDADSHIYGFMLFYFARPLFRQIMALVTRQGLNIPPNNTNPNNMTPEFIQAMIDQALLRNSTNEDESHSLHEDNQRNVQTAPPCFYADFMKYKIFRYSCVCDDLGSTQEEDDGQILSAWRNQETRIELWNLKVKWNDILTYTEHFQELTLICTKLVIETEKIDKYISGLPDNICGSVKSSKPKTLDETIELANDFMDQKLCTYAKRKTNNKRKVDDSSRNNHGHQQQPAKRQNVAKVYNMGSGERKPYGGNLPKCTKCHFHHNGLCTQKCHKCNNVGHFACDCRSSGNTNVYAVGNAEKKGNALRDPDSNVVTGMSLLNNGYASILFDTGTDRSFISTEFSSLIDIVPTPLGNNCDVELADGKIVRGDIIIRCRTINFLNHPFKIDLIPVELGSFDVIISMDWLRRCHAIIVCDEKLVRVPYGNETLIFYGDESNDGRESRLIIISCSKAQEYMTKGCQTFLAQISAKKEEDKSKGKQL